MLDLTVRVESWLLELYISSTVRIERYSSFFPSSFLRLACVLCLMQILLTSRVYGEAPVAAESVSSVAEPSKPTATANVMPIIEKEGAGNGKGPTVGNGKDPNANAGNGDDVQNAGNGKSSKRGDEPQTVGGALNAVGDVRKDVEKTLEDAKALLATVKEAAAGAAPGLPGVFTGANGNSNNSDSGSTNSTGSSSPVSTATAPSTPTPSVGAGGSVNGQSEA